ncbi:hypothetical protein GCM10011496_15210 [Polaromonas eurypsychrophila]|uniref:Uncharacterized protein n=1 Tax=Polaromonas eurypsychrophila TaxID=1614635 RepID=A0A916SEF5_9BURK|nr:hypothetical protein GCM10011496_15210 [Polaromonas eurypsychrophila]
MAREEHTDSTILRVQSEIAHLSEVLELLPYILGQAAFEIGGEIVNRLDLPLKAVQTNCLDLYTDGALPHGSILFEYRDAAIEEHFVELEFVKDYVAVQ